MTVGGNANSRRWAPEWIAVLTLAVAIVALGGSLFASLNAMEARLRGDLQEMREDMRAMEARVREDMREVRADLGTVRERVTRLEARFDEEYPRRTHSALELL